MRFRNVLLIEPAVRPRIAFGRDLARLGFVVEKPEHLRDALVRLGEQEYGAVVARLGSNQLASAFAELLSAAEPEQLRRTILLVEGEAGPDELPLLFRHEPYAVVIEPVEDRLPGLVADCIDAAGTSEGTRWVHAGRAEWKCRRCFDHFSNAQLCVNIGPDECRVHLRTSRASCGEGCASDSHEETCVIDRIAADEFAETWCGMFER